MSMKPDEDITSLTPDIISRQSTITIGTFGNVAHGKSTVVRAVTGVQTERFQSERERNMTIKLGYANAKIYKCDNTSCPRPGCYRSYGGSKEDEFPCDRPACSGKLRILRHVSFVDCPGTDILLATMMNGASVMDAAFLIIACNQPCPQTQTSEHLAVVEIMESKHILILQNKIDLVNTSPTQEEHYQQILSFVSGTTAQGAPVIPISAHYKENISDVLEFIAKIPEPERDFRSPPRLRVIRSFDINKPGTNVGDLKGGVLGGSIMRGVLKIGQEIEIRPGIVSKNSDSKIECRPIKSIVVSLFAEQNELPYAVPGGLIGVGTTIDPKLCKADKMVGQILGVAGHLPDIYLELTAAYFLLRRMLGVKVFEGDKPQKVQRLMRNEILLVKIASLTTGGRVIAVKSDLVKIALSSPACIDKGEKVIFCRRVDRHWRLIGYGIIKDGIKIEPIRGENIT